MGQAGSCLRQARSNASISKVLSNCALREEKSGVKYAKSFMQVLLPRNEDARAAILDLDGYSIRSFGSYDGFTGGNTAHCCANKFPIELLKEEENYSNLANAMWRVFFREDLDNPAPFNLPTCLKNSACLQKFANVKDVATSSLRNENQPLPITLLMNKHTSINNWTSKGRLFSTEVHHVASGEPSQENTIIISLDDSLEEFRENYVGGLSEITEFCYNNGKRVDISEVCDGQQEMFTTPRKGIFWLKLVCGERHVFFPVIANNLYILGWKGGKWGAFVTRGNDSTHGYHLLDQAKMLSFTESHHDLDVEDLSATRVGPFAIRDAFDILYWFRGHDHKAARQALGIIIFNFCEAARFRKLSKAISASFSDLMVPIPSVGICEYGSTCKHTMKDIADCLKNQQPVKESTSEALQEIRIFNRSGCEEGVFKYEDSKNVRSKYQKSRSQSSPFVSSDWFSDDELRKKQNSK